MSELRNLNDWRVFNSIQYEYETAAQQAIIEELRALRAEVNLLRSHQPYTAGTDRLAAILNMEPNLR